MIDEGETGWDTSKLAVELGEHRVVREAFCTSACQVDVTGAHLRPGEVCESLLEALRDLTHPTLFQEEGSVSDSRLLNEVLLMPPHLIYEIRKALLSLQEAVCGPVLADHF